MAIRTIRGDRLQVVVSYRDANSIVHRVSRMVPAGGGIRKAEELERQIRNELDVSKPTAAARTATVIEIVDRWLQLHRTNIRTTSANEYHRRIDRWIRPHPIANVRIQKLTTQHVDAHLAKLTRDGLSPRTVKSIASVLSMAFNRAVRWGLMARNPADAATLPRSVETTITPPSENLTAAILSAAHRQHPLWGLWIHIAVAGTTAHATHAR